jgi:hypothetical protein
VLEDRGSHLLVNNHKHKADILVPKKHVHDISRYESMSTKKSEVLEKPYKSDAQRKWAHTEKGTKALGGEAKVLSFKGAYGHKAGHPTAPAGVHKRPAPAIKPKTTIPPKGPLHVAGPIKVESHNKLVEHGYTPIYTKKKV